MSTCGETLTGPGIYELTGDLFCGGAGAAITITGADVLLDLDDHTLWGDLTVAGEGIRVQSATGFSITNGSVNDFYRAVWTQQSTDGRVAGITVDGAGEAFSLTGVVLRETPPPLATCAGRPATIMGTPGADTLVGTTGDDVIVAGAGADRVAGRGGDDLVLRRERP